MKAKDIMIPIHDYLKPESTRKDAVNLFRTGFRGEDRVGIMGAPVLDEKGKWLAYFICGIFLPSQKRYLRKIMEM